MLVGNTGRGDGLGEPAQRLGDSEMNLQGDELAPGRASRALPLRCHGVETNMLIGNTGCGDGPGEPVQRLGDSEMNLQGGESAPGQTSRALSLRLHASR